jgi:hypothetical protein
VLQSAATVDVSMTLRYIIQIIGSVVVLFTLSWSLTLVMLAVVPVVAVGAVAYGRFLKRLKRAFQDALADSNAFASECIRCGSGFPFRSLPRGRGGGADRRRPATSARCGRLHRRSARMPASTGSSTARWPLGRDRPCRWVCSRAGWGLWPRRRWRCVPVAAAVVVVVHDL